MVTMHGCRQAEETVVMKGSLLVSETNCIRQPTSSYIHNSYTGNTQNICERVITKALQRCNKKLVTRWGKHRCYDGFQCILIVKWTWQWVVLIMQLVSKLKQTSHNHCLFSNQGNHSVIQPICFYGAARHAHNVQLVMQVPLFSNVIIKHCLCSSDMWDL